VLMSAAFGGLDTKSLVEWTLEDGLLVRVQLQLHKYIWGRDTQGV
jgi:7-carboxy-7-deazaguanine synthase